MSERGQDQLNELIESILETSKYRNVNRDFISRIGAQELGKHPKVKQAVKATKNKLHVVAGAFLEYKPDFGRQFEKLARVAYSGNANELRQVCVDIMALHSSTRERLPILDQFYALTLGDLPPIRSVIDIACGLNPLAIPWMPLVEGAKYEAYDIYEDMLSFLEQTMRLLHVRGQVHVGDITQSPPDFKADVAFVLKAIPCLEQIDKNVGSRLFESINAHHVLVSFPVRTLCGKSKGMTANYENKFRALVAGKDWIVRRFDFPSELVFRIAK